MASLEKYQKIQCKAELSMPKTLLYCTDITNLAIDVFAGAGKSRIARAILPEIAVTYVKPVQTLYCTQSLSFRLNRFY